MRPLLSEELAQSALDERLRVARRHDLEALVRLPRLARLRLGIGQSLISVGIRLTAPR